MASAKFWVVVIAAALVISAFESKSFRLNPNRELSGNESQNVSPVLVEVYYSVLCRDSINFVTRQLYPTVQKVNELVNISLVPYGKASQNSDSTGQWNFVCQFGSRECAGNLAQTCAIKHVTQTDPSTTIPLVLSFVNCMESARDPSAAGPDCAAQLGIDYTPIANCASSLEGNQLQHTMGLRTEALNPRLNFVPWIVVNGVRTNESQQRALRDLLGLVCDTYTGSKPEACNDLPSK